MVEFGNPRYWNTFLVAAQNVFRVIKQRIWIEPDDRIQLKNLVRDRKQTGNSRRQRSSLILKVSRCSLQESSERERHKTSEMP